MSVRCPYCGGPTDYLTVGQVARLLGLSEPTTRQKIRDGHFPGSELVQGIHNRGMWRVPLTAVLPLLEVT